MKHLIQIAAKTTILAAFATVLVLPAFQMLTDVFPPAYPINEGRALAPPLSRNDIAPLGRLWSRAQAWFRDHYGLRPWLVRVKGQMDYSLFGVADRVYVGSDGWLFYRDAIDKGEVLNDQLSSAAIDRIIDNFARLRDRLATRGVHLIVMPNQLKTRLYREYFPRRAGGLAEHHDRFDEMDAKLRALPGITYFDTTEILLRLKTTMPIFHKTDIHWNDAAAFEVSRGLVERIAEIERRPSPWKYDLEILHNNPFYIGMESSNMPKLHPPEMYEDGVFIKEKTISETVRLREKPNKTFELTAESLETKDQVLPGITVYGDSFFDGMIRSGFQNHFQFFYRARWGHAPLADTLAHMPAATRYFVFQFIEPHMFTFQDMPIGNDNPGPAVAAK